jgi:chitinase
VSYATADGSGVAPGDYTASSGTVVFPPGTTTQSLVVPVAGDALNESDEYFSVNLTAATNATLAVSQARGTIVNDDPLPGLSIADVRVAEGKSGTTIANFVVSLSAASGRRVTVSYATANGTATAGSDYTAVSGVLVFLPGEVTKTISVPIAGDTIAEPDETFTVNLSTPSNATVTQAQGVCTIVNDDEPVVQPHIKVFLPLVAQS